MKRLIVIPAGLLRRSKALGYKGWKAGIQKIRNWIPIFMGMTEWKTKKACHSAIGGSASGGKHSTFPPLRLGKAPLRRDDGCILPALSKAEGHSAFSLIEVLVSMTVLIVIIVMVTNMFRNASEAWDMGTQRAEMNTAARAAVEYIARELSCAVAGSISDLTGSTITLKRFQLEKNAMDDNVHDLSFIALSGTNERLRGIRFRYDNNGNHFIETARETDSSFLRYDSANWGGWPNAYLLITNVWKFQVTVCSNESDMMSGGVGDAYDSSAAANSNLLPACVDISIEMLNERDMTRALNLGAAQDGFVMTNSRVYTTRVCFPNRGGSGR